MKKNHIKTVSLAILIFPFVVTFAKESVSFKSELINNSIVIIGDNNTINKNISVPSTAVEVYSSFVDPLSTSNRKYFSEDFQTPVYREYENNIAYPKFKGLYEGKDYLYKYFSNKNVNALDRMLYMDYRENVKSKPAYEIRVVNNTNRSISIDKVVFNVRKSSPYKKPIVIFLKDEWKLGKLLLFNERNQKIRRVRLNYNINRNKSKYSSSYKYASNFIWNSNSDLYEVDLKDSLMKSGVDIDYLRSTIAYNGDENFIYPHVAPKKTKQALGIFSSQLPTKKWEEMYKKKYVIYPQFQAYIQGKYEIEAEYEGKLVIKRGRFNAEIPLTAVHFHALGDIETSVINTNIKFKMKGSNYPLEINMAKYIKPFAAERYLFLLDSLDSSVHKFYPSIVLSDGRTITSRQKKIYIYKPKGN